MTPKLAEMKRTKAKEEWPQVVTESGVSVRIYRGSNRGRPIYTVSYVTAHEGRKRANFADPDDARKQARAIAQTIARGEANVLKMSGEDRAVYVAAEEALRELGNVSLLAAVRDYVDACKILGGNFVVEAARDYAPRRQGFTRKTVAEAVEAYRAAKVKAGVSPRYERDLRVILTAFSKAFRTMVDSVSRPMLFAYLDGLKCGNVSRDNHRRVLAAFLQFAKEMEWTPAGQPTAAEGIKPWRALDNTVDYFRPTEAEALLRAADPDFLPWLLLIGWAGVRRDEVSRLDWSAIRFPARKLYLPKEAAKGKQGKKKARVIDLQPNVMEWLASYAERRGPICDMADTTVQEHIARTCTAAGVKWRQNSLRHSFGTYAVGKTKNVGEVALWMGNSAAMVMAHYNGVAGDDAEIAAYWNIMPTRPGNVIPIEGAA